MQSRGFLDTNVLLRHVLQDHEDHSPQATAFVVGLERGEHAVRLADTVVFEATFTLEKTYGVPRHEIRDALIPILDLPTVVLPGKRIYYEVFDLYVREPGFSFADCYHLILTLRLDLPAILSFDRKLSRFPGITRIEP
jgi:predicted nucleic acid-binding protein